MFPRPLAMTFSIFFLAHTLLAAHPGKVVQSFPLPAQFPTGITFDGDNLWMADYKADKLFMLDKTTGAIKREIPSPGFWPMGLAWDGEHLWNVDGEDKKIFKVDPKDGTILFVIEAPSSKPEGLAWDGETLWVSDGRARKIMKIDLSDGTAVKTLTAPAKSANGLTFDGTYLWCSDRTADEIYMMDPKSGEVILIIDAPGPYPRGLAWDGGCLWNADYQKDVLYRLAVRDGETYRLKNPRRARITLTHEVKAFGSGKLKQLDVYLAVPEGMPQQKVLSKTFSPEGFELIHDRWNQPIAHFQYRDIPSESTIQSKMEVAAEISEIQYFIFPDRCGTLEDIPEEIREMYTSNESKYMTDDPYIRDTAAKLAEDEENPYYIARRIFDHVRNALEYKLEGGWNVAPVVLERGTGSCSEYSFSFIALCRAAGLPARYVGAIVVRGDDASLDDVFHRWPEVYLPNYGWIPIDPQGGDKASPRDRARNIGSLSNRFLITTQGGGGSEYLGWYYNYNESYVTDPQVKVQIEPYGEWEPLEEE